MTNGALRGQCMCGLRVCHVWVRSPALPLPNCVTFYLSGQFPSTKMRLPWLTGWVRWMTRAWNVLQTARCAHTVPFLPPPLSDWRMPTFPPETSISKFIYMDRICKRALETGQISTRKYENAIQSNQKGWLGCYAKMVLLKYSTPRKTK